MTNEQSGTPNPEDRRKHLDYIQAIVTRMSAASSSAKSWLLPVVTAAFGFALTQHSGSIAVLGLVAVLVFAYLDANYLRQERAYRRLYTTVATTSGRVPLYSLDPTDADDSPPGTDGTEPKQKVLALVSRWIPHWGIWLSWSIAPFYGALVLLGAATLTHALLTSP